MRPTFLRLALLGLASASLLSACADDDDRGAVAGPSGSGLTLIDTSGPDPDRVIVAFKPGRASQGRAAVHAHGGNGALDIRGMDAVAVSLPAAARAALASNPNVEYVEEDAVRRVSGSGTEETIPYGITMVQADQQAAGPFARKICIIDSGYSMQHEDLRDSNVTASPDPGTGDPFFDDNGHGTHVAGTIAAIGGNFKGVVGVMPSVNLHIVKVFTKAGWAYSSSLANAAQACADNGANIISMSLGGSTKNRTEENKFKALTTAGIFSIAAAGNDGTNRVSYPAGYASVMSVGALDANQVTADFSQFNADVEISAPGVAVESSTPWLSVASISVAGTDHTGHSVEGAANGTATGALVDGGLCLAADASWAGKIVLCQRGDITFADKVLAGQNGGATAVVIYNNVAGDLYASGSTSTIPAIGVSMAIGEALLTKVGQTATLTSTVTQQASGYEAWDGTSMATPHVAGVAALVWSHNASWTNVQIRNALTSSAFDLGAPGRDVNYGYGLVQAAAALTSLGGGGGGPVNQAPTASFNWTCTGLSCTFDGGNSADPDGSIASYGWSFGGTSSTAAFNFTTGGTHLVTLTVTDNLGATGSTTQSVTVNDPNPSTLTISNVTSAKTSKSGAFKITWTTNVPADSLVTFVGIGAYPNATLVTSHSMSFSGQRGATYTYSVSSTDAAGTTQTSGPYTHQN